MKHYLWYNSQDQFFYDNYSHCFDGLAINAHIIAHNAKAFLAGQLKNHKPFFVLPDIHALQFHSPEYFDSGKGGIRLSWDKLQEVYPKIVRKVLVEKRSLKPQDFDSHRDLDEFVSTILMFQRNDLQRSYEALSRLLPAGASPPSPEFLVAPYFFFDGTSDDWYPIAATMAMRAAQLKQQDKLFAVVFCSKDSLVPAEIATVVSDFSQGDVDGFLIWVDDFDELKESQLLLEGFLQLVKGLSATGKPVFNLFGGHFSVLLKYFGLSGYVSGICTRDNMPARPPIQTGGPAGGPIPKYYVPKLHLKLIQEEAQRLIGQTSAFGCDCKVCSEQAILTLPSTTKSERSTLRRLMREHFLCVSTAEGSRVNSERVGLLLEELSDAASIGTAEYPVLDYSHLGRWSDVLRRGS